MPLAADANVLARALTDDGSEQSRRAVDCFRDNEIFVPDTVLLETEWLLRSRLGLKRDQVDGLVWTLLSSPRVLFDDRTRVANATIAHRNGLDFADAMHLFASNACEVFVTYDGDLIRNSRKIPETITVRKP
jgi:predicted nucleic-acid-binding protein